MSGTVPYDRALAPLPYYPAYTKIAATNALADSYAQEYQALVHELRAEGLDDAEAVAAAVLAEVFDLIIDGMRFAPIEEAA